MSLNDSKIIEYPNYTFMQEYRIDKEGNVYSPWRGWSEMSQHLNRSGYKEVSLYTKEEGRRIFKVHRLLLQTFQPINNPEDFQVNHKDGIKSHNDFKNLEWCTRSENIKHAFRTGLEKRPIGTSNPSAKLNEDAVRDICSRLEEKQTLQSIADLYKVSKGTIAHIKQRRAWMHISKDYNF